MKKGA
jgi:hypothetical protein